ncbi:glycosyltransferase [Providencia sp. wls1922]|uniref:glycosyltransferase n=1 Tax=Providencia sp. wls1922 TaxID=2675152 RepID=UPI0012B657FB|nr:glycosyltransferase [Providencia sp. wls1922]
MLPIKIVFIGCNPKVIGGANSFTRSVGSFFGHTFYIYPYIEKEIYNIKIEGHSKGIFPWTLTYRIINKITRKKILLFLMRRFIRANLCNVAILNTPSLYYACPKNVKKILVQHTSVDKWLTLKTQFNNNYRLIEKCKNETIIVALSPKDKIDIINKMNVDEKNIYVIRNSTNIPKLNIPKKKKKKLVMLARFDNDIKRIDLAISAMKHLPDFDLYIYGDGKDRDYLCFLSKEYSNVHLLKSSSNIKSILDDSGIYICTSDYEGYPISCIEAMARGLPLIVRNTFSSASDIVIDNGILLSKEWNEFEFLNAVSKIYNNYEYYSNNSLELYERHNPEVIKRLWIELVNGVYNAS